MEWQSFLSRQLRIKRPRDANCDGNECAYSRRLIVNPPRRASQKGKERAHFLIFVRLLILGIYAELFSI